MGMVLRNKTNFVNRGMHGPFNSYFCLVCYTVQRTCSDLLYYYHFVLFIFRHFGLAFNIHSHLKNGKCHVHRSGRLSQCFGVFFCPAWKYDYLTIFSQSSKLPHLFIQTVWLTCTEFQGQVLWVGEANFLGLWEGGGAGLWMKICFAFPSQADLFRNK